MNTAFVFDFDGTITKKELLPVVAESLGLTNEIKILTDLTINGTIPFESSFRLRFAILKAAKLSEVQDAVSKIELDKNIVNFINANHQNCYIVTGNIPEWIAPLTQHIKCRVISSQAEIVANTLKKISYVMNKTEPLLSLRDRYKRLVAIGEGANDVPMFSVADIGIAYGAVHEPARSLMNISDYIVYKSESLCRLLNTLL